MVVRPAGVAAPMLAPFNIWPFVTIAIEACQCEVAFHRQPTMLPWNDVINFEWHQ